jgi:hypothetical protein
MLRTRFSHSSKSILALSLLFPLISLNSGCASVEPTVVVKTDYVVKDIPIQSRPKAMNLHRVKFYAVTPENMEEFITRFEEESGTTVFFAMSVPDYENMSMNVAELRRYINQQKALIVYYEESIETMIKETPEDTEEVVQEGTDSVFDLIKFD